MRILWNAQESAFELQFNDFKTDLEWAKAAGFKTTGPPQWIWFSNKVKCLRYLKKNRPPSGLTITQDALAEFEKRAKEEDEKARVVKAYKDAKTRLQGKPKRAAKLRATSSLNPNEIKYEVPYIKYVPPTAPSELCIYCRNPVYSIYERIEPLPICLWCEKMIMDNQDE